MCGRSAVDAPQPRPFRLSTHCGVDELKLDGRWYERADGPLHDGNRNPPEGWDNPFQDGVVTVHGDSVEFRDEEGHVEHFVLRPEATGPKALCS